MGKTIPALVTPEVLVWARNLDGFSVEEMAKKLHVSPEIIQEWESGASCPSITKAKVLAKYYRVPYIYFFLPDTPRKTKRIERADYRTFGNLGAPAIMSRELKWLLRDIEDRRDTMLLLYEEDGQEPQPFPVLFNADEDQDKIASALRDLLVLNKATQMSFRKPEMALSHCISVLEQYDVLVFQAAKIDPAEMRGLSLAYETMPIIVLNRKEEPAARLFTLIHELVHVVTRTSGVCNETTERSKTDNELERFCNGIAGKVLVPLGELRAHRGIAHIMKFGFDDSFVAAIARDFAVSKEVILHCLLDLGIISRQFYFQTLKRYSDEYKEYAARKPKGFLPPALDAGTQLGKLYSKTVLSAYYRESISPSSASDYLLSLKAKNFPKLEGWCF